MLHQSPGGSRPNIIFIIMDDMAWGDLSCHGNPHIQTPHLDALYAHSTRLTRYCSGPLCTPARASVLTGRYHQRTAAIDTYLGRSTMHPDEVTVAELLQQSGYHTSIFGKWHLGDHTPTRPFEKGFELSITHGGGGIGQAGDYPGNSYFDPVLDHNGTFKKRDGYCTDIFFGDAIESIKQCTTNGQPFFTYIGTNCPHTPMQISEFWVQPFRKKGLSERQAQLYGMIQNIDSNVGKLVQQLETLSILDDTLLIFTSDHGPCGSSVDHEGNFRFNGDLRAHKGTLYEGGIRVPCLLHWPNGLAPNRDIDRITHPIDWLPTLMQLSGDKVANPQTIDGRDLTPLLTADNADNWPERQLFMQWHRGNETIRYLNYAVIEQDYKLYRPHEAETEELYCILTDPRETTDLATEHPERVEAMKQAYEKWFTDVSNTRGPDTYAAIPSRIGNTAEPVVRLNRQDWRLYGEVDNWTYREPGYWPVYVDSPGPFEIQVHLDPLLVGATGMSLHLSCGDYRAAITLDQAEAVYAFDGIQLELGAQTLEAYLSDKTDTKLGVAHVIIKAATAWAAG